MKGFIELIDALEKDAVPCTVNVQAITHFHALDNSLTKRMFESSGSIVNDTKLPKTIVYLNAKDSDGNQVIFRIAKTVDELIKQIEAAQ